MSKYMLCDQDTINDINPFVSRDFSLPGGVRQQTEFADRSLVKEKPGMEIQEEKSPYCEYGLTSGWRTNEMCRPQGTMCVDERPLYPERNIDYGRVIHTKQDHPRRRWDGAGAIDFRHFLILFILILLIVTR